MVVLYPKNPDPVGGCFGFLSLLERPTLKWDASGTVHAAVISEQQHQPAGGIWWCDTSFEVGIFQIIERENCSNNWVKWGGGGGGWMSIIRDLQTMEVELPSLQQALYSGVFRVVPIFQVDLLTNGLGTFYLTFSLLMQNFCCFTILCASV